MFNTNISNNLKAHRATTQDSIMFHTLGGWLSGIMCDWKIDPTGTLISGLVKKPGYIIFSEPPK